MATWFRDAKFGIWSHWGPQSVPMRGDWYARRLYLERREPGPEEIGPTSRRLFHEARFGHPSIFGFKDVCREWKAQSWDPADLMDLYVRAGARYFVALANHIDNFDLWDSVHQPWNSVNVGPKVDVLERWERAARDRGLPFGISLHANWAWELLDVAFGADEDGPYAGVPYDGRLTRGGGKGTWWDGMDPRDLYGRPRTGDEPPDPDFVDRFYRRAWDAFERHRPQLVYFDDTRPPFAEGSVREAVPPSPRGRQLIERMTASGSRWYGEPGILTVKRLHESDGGSLTLDVERNLLSAARTDPWQMDTCLGHWFYDDGLTYKTAGQVLRMLVDVVSKNGTLLLSVPQLPDGTIDEREVQILEEIGAWMRVNGAAIYGTRPWTACGEGPTTGDGERFREQDLPYTGEDIRFTMGKDALYATVLGEPTGSQVQIRCLGRSAGLLDRDPERIELLGADGALSWERAEDHLRVRVPSGVDWSHPLVLAISGVVARTAA